MNIGIETEAIEFKKTTGELSPEQLRALMFKKEEIDKISKTEAENQNLTFTQLKSLYITNGLTINNEYFEDNLGLKLKDGKYNYMAELLADKNDVSIKVVTFKGKDKTEMVRRTEFGYKCLISAMQQVLTHIESLNETMVKIGTQKREERFLFDISPT